ncbi:MAG: hypothetical protein P1V97_29810 [Planctomycetota bacterium]|nr:hypothetical protein [Planctomycetota bacterium]
MGYYMRFLTTDKVVRGIPFLNRELQKRNPKWELEFVANAKRPSALLKYGSELYGEFEVNLPGDGLFTEEIEELGDFISHLEKRDAVEKVLKDATAIYALRVLWQGRDSEATLDTLQVFWEVLFSLHSGLLQADDDGYYDAEKRVLAVP